MYILEHSPLYISLKNTFQKLALLPSSDDTIQPDQLGRLEKPNLNRYQLAYLQQWTHFQLWLGSETETGHMLSAAAACIHPKETAQPT
jgi:hypothetical protein